MASQYLILKQKENNFDSSLIRDVLKEAMGYIKFSQKDTYILVSFENENNINLNDLLTMMNVELYLNVQGFVSKKDVTDSRYLDWAIETFLENDFMDKYLVCEKDLIKIKTTYLNDTVKRCVLKSYYDDRDSINMLKVFFECNLNTSKACELLYMHRNTLINKLDRFYEVTGYDLRKFSDAMIIASLI